MKTKPRTPTKPAKARRNDLPDACDALVAREPEAEYITSPSVRTVRIPPAGASGFRAARVSLGVTQEEFRRISGISVRALSLLETGAKPLTANDTRRLQEIERLRIELQGLMKPGHIGDWLRGRNPALGGMTPIQAIEIGEADRVWRLIWRVEDNAAG